MSNAWNSGGTTRLARPLKGSAEWGLQENPSTHGEPIGRREVFFHSGRPAVELEPKPSATPFLGILWGTEALSLWHKPLPGICWQCSKLPSYLKKVLSHTLFWPIRLTPHKIYWITAVFAQNCKKKTNFPTHQQPIYQHINYETFVRNKIWKRWWDNLWFHGMGNDDTVSSAMRSIKIWRV